MLPPEVVPRHENRRHRGMVSVALGVSIRQASEAADVHPNRQVESLAVARADFCGVRVSEARHFFYGGYRGRAVPRFGLAGRVRLD